MSGPIHERRRAEITAEIPATYSPALHLSIPSALGLAAIAAALAWIRDLRAIELLAVPVTMLFAFGFEWRVHKSVLHQRVPGLSILYVRHELHHHVVYTDADMAMRSSRELRLILMPVYAIVLIFLLDLPLALLTEKLVTWNVGCLYLATSMLFFLTYEWLHCAYHLPEESFIGRIGVIRRLRELHRRHHDPRLMKAWNFNVTVPVFDLIYGTIWTPKREVARGARAARRAS